MLIPIVKQQHSNTILKNYHSNRKKYNNKMCFFSRWRTCTKAQQPRDNNKTVNSIIF